MRFKSLRKIAILTVSLTLLKAYSLENILKSYENGQYWKSCSLCQKSIKLYKDKDEFLNFCALSCLKANELEKMASFASLLKKTPLDRKNSIYFLTILYQKELLFHSILDGKDISFVKIPKTNYILSDIFVRYVKKDYIKKGKVYIFPDKKNPNIFYKLSIEKMGDKRKLFLRTFKGKILLETRIY